MRKPSVRPRPHPYERDRKPISFRLLTRLGEGPFWGGKIGVDDFLRSAYSCVLSLSDRIASEKASSYVSTTLRYRTRDVVRPEHVLLLYSRRTSPFSIPMYRERGSSIPMCGNIAPRIFGEDR